MSEYNLRDCRSALRLSGDTGETLVVRTCGLDSNEQTADVELVRVPHTCGIFKFEATEEEQGRDSIGNFWLEKPLEFWLEIPYTKKMFKN